MTSGPHSSTARRPVRLPPMPSERQAAAYPTATLERARVTGGRLTFEHPDGFRRSLTQGFFLVEIPDRMDVAAGDRLAAHFHEAPRGDQLDRYRGYREIHVPGNYQGYFDREHDQWENLYVERQNWDRLPADVAGLGAEMADLGIAVLRSVLAGLRLPEADWAEVTGGLTDGRGHQMLAFNHFRPEKAVRGSKFHRDSGWVTILRSTEPGLLALIQDRLYSVNPEPGYFIANFGSSIEVLTERLGTPVRANIHGVVQTERGPDQSDRTSYVIFLDSDLAGTIYHYENGAPRAVQSVADFAVQEVSRTYDGDDGDL